MTAISFSFRGTPAPSLPLLPPRAFFSPPAPNVNMPGLSAPSYVSRYQQATRPNLISPAAPQYGSAVAAPGGGASGTLGSLPTLPAYDRAVSPGSSGVRVPDAPTITPDAAPALGSILSLESDIQVATPGSVQMPSSPPVPTMATSITTPTRTGPIDLLGVIRNHASLDHAARSLMLEARTEYLDRNAVRAEQSAMSDAAARGFSAPLGIATDAVLEIAHETSVAKRKAAESVRDEALELGRERLATAVAAAVEAEAKAAGVLLEAGKLLIEHDQQLIALAKEVLRELIGAYDTRVEIINEAIAEYQGYLDQVEASNAGRSAANSVNIAKAKNEAIKVGVYEGQLTAAGAGYEIMAESVEAQANTVREIRAYVDYVQAQARISREEIRAFEEIVRGYSQSFGARSAQLQAYASRVEAEASPAAVFAANASAYANFWRGEASRAQGEARFISESAQAYNTEIQNFSRYAQAFRSYVSSVGDAVSLSETALRAWAQSNQSAIRAAAAYNRAAAERASAENAINLQRMDEANTRSILSAQTTILNNRIEGSIRQAQAQALAARAQAAYAVTSETARVNRSGQIATIGSVDESTRNTANFNRQWEVRTQWEEEAV